MKMWSKGLVGTLCVLGLAAALGGCSNNKKQSDLAMQESTELRERNATLEQGVREKDARIAELETKLANCNTTPTQAWAPAPSPVGYTPPAPIARSARCISSAMLPAP